MERPLLLKLAIRGELAVIVSSAVPLLSEKMAWLMVVLSKARDMLAGERLPVKTILSLPGSVEMVRFTGRKFGTRRGGVLESVRL
jgi:hypothetical protein